MPNIFLILFLKDIKIIFCRERSFVASFVPGLIIFMLFAFSVPMESSLFWGPTLFCLASVLALPFLVFNIFSLDAVSHARYLFISMHVPLRLIWLAKLAASLFFLLFIQIFLALFCYVFVGLAPFAATPVAIMALVLLNIALVLIALLLAPLFQSGTGKDTLLLAAFLPLVAPVLFNGVDILHNSINTETASFAFNHKALLFLLAFNLVFTGASLALFPLLYREYT